MRKKRQSRGHSQRGIALLIAIFVLLLISVVAIALLVSSGTETALGANYRYSSTVYYAGLAGLEEARGRLLARNPNSLVPSYITPGTTLALGQTIYIVNPSSGETVQPWDPSGGSNPAYYDSEYQNEFGVPASGASWQSVNSVWVGNSNPGPLYKWVRINAATEQSIHVDVNYDGVYDNTTPLFYDPANIASGGTPWPSLILNSSPPSTAVQALEVTALAYLPNGTPNGSKKLLQYVVAPITANITFPSAMTLDGYSDSYSGPSSSRFQISGDQDSGDSACGGSITPYPVDAIAVPDRTDATDVKDAIISIGESANYTGSGSTPSVKHVSMPTNLQTVQNLDQIAQSIIQNADSVITGPATQANMPSAMSSSNPMTVAIAGTTPSQGNLTLSGGFTGYGLLLVTGNLSYTSDISWNGVVLVIGQGNVSVSGSGGGGTFNGAMLVAQTRDSSGNLLPGPNPGPATFGDSSTSPTRRGYFYNCSWILTAQAPLTYKVISFHEIPQ
jgi:hypothetical protein